jgi:hypothetical protein
VGSEEEEEEEEEEEKAGDAPESMTMICVRLDL